MHITPIIAQNNTAPRFLSQSRAFLFVLGLVFSLFFCVVSPLAYAQMEQELAVRHAHTSVLAEYGAVKPGDEITLATQIDLSEHWHVYWRNPGDSGLPVSIKWDLPEGFEISGVSWPTPDKISYDVLANYGYFNKVALLQTLKIPAVIPQGKITLTAHIDMLVCNNICTPESDEVSVFLNDPDNLTMDNSAVIKAAQAKMPKEIKGMFFFYGNENVLRLSLNPEDRTILSAATTDNTEFFPHDWGIINHASSPKIRFANGNVTIEHERGGQPISTDKLLKGLLVIKGDIGQNTGYQINASPAEEYIKPVIVNKANISGETALSRFQAQTAPRDAMSALADHRASHLTWISAILLAFLGGLALNLMPCVFPVLSIKALSLVEMKGKQAAQARLHGLFYSAGVILSFLLIAGTLIVFKHAGAAIGWGFQLQNPLVVGILAYLLFLIGMNLSGVFALGGGLCCLGSNFAHNHSCIGSFFTGALAALVATPCTAPFMGAAMGFALTQSAGLSLIVFAVLGLGLALPYLILSFVPQLRGFLPKPGQWMETFRQFLAFPMFASSLWLVWVLSQQTGTSGIFLALMGLLLIAFALWLSGKAYPSSGKVKAAGGAAILARIMMIAAIMGTIYTLGALRDIRSPEQNDHMHTSSSFGAAYTKAGLSELLRGDDPVFVEMTAAWCITCKLNHASVMNTQATRDLFEKKNVHYVIGDWTNRNAEITEYLDAFERNGVPLYVYYGKRDPITKMRPQAIVLPQILTSGRLRRAIGACENTGTIFFYYPQTSEEGEDSCSTE